MEIKHLTPALPPFCSADSAKRGEGETLPAFVGVTQSAMFFAMGKDDLKVHPGDPGQRPTS